MQTESQQLAENELGTALVEISTQVHTELGPGLLESVYEVILADELRKSGLHVERQIPIPLEYKGLRFDEGFRADLIIEDRVIVELKCVDKINNSHRKQLLTYLRLANKRLGYLLNFNETLMRNGIHRFVNRLVEKSR